MNPMIPFDQAAGLLPFGMRQLALALPQAERAVTEEFRLRVGRPLSVTLPEGEVVLPGCPAVTPDDLRTSLEIATQASVHTALERVRQGFVTVRGGHRVGLCGTAVIRDGHIHNLSELSSLNIRIARQIRGTADDIVRNLREEGKLDSILILAPPGAGKTTLLRDMIRGLSSGVGGPPLRIGVADERGELAAVYEGVPQLDLGAHADIMSGCGKADGLLMLLRSMNPQILAVDEITAPRDIDALETACGCGTLLLATAHGRSLEDLRRRPLYAELLRRNIFHKVLLIERREGVRSYQLKDIPC